MQFKHFCNHLYNILGVVMCMRCKMCCLYLPLAFFFSKIKVAATDFIISQQIKDKIATTNSCVKITEFSNKLDYNANFTPDVRSTKVFLESGKYGKLYSCITN